MSRSFSRAVRVGAASLALALAATAASATTWDFVTNNGGDKQVGFTTYKTTKDGLDLNVRVSGWTTAPKAGKPGFDTISKATLGLWQPGLGVLAAGESASDAQHQIDNKDGVDFVMLQFDREVTLTSLSRMVYSIGSNKDSDAQYWADTGHIIGTTATWKNNVSLVGNPVDESKWETLEGGSSHSVTPVKTSLAASVWLIAAAFTPTDDRDDGFKIAGFSFATPTVASVPEPSSWATMLAGFAGIGFALRRQRGAKPALTA